MNVINPTDSNSRMIVSIGGLLGKLEIIHNLRDNRIVFAVMNAGGITNYASFDANQTEHIRITFTKYLEAMQTKND